jgi:hypothetical protein
MGMIVLDNYSEADTYIIINTKGYSIANKRDKRLEEHGEGGFTEDKQLVGIYVEANKLFFQYNDKKYETSPDQIVFSNTKIDKENRHFQVKISNQIVCDIIYKPYLSPHWLLLDGDEDEFDFLLYLSNMLKNRDAILNFIKAIPEINKYRMKDKDEKPIEKPKQ